MCIVRSLGLTLFATICMDGFIVTHMCKRADHGVLSRLHCRWSGRACACVNCNQLQHGNC